MKVPKAGMLCGWCRKPVIRHQQAIEEFVPVPNDREGRLRKQLYHKKKCWSKEQRARLNRARNEARGAATMLLRNRERLDEIAMDPELIEKHGREFSDVEKDMIIRSYAHDRPEAVANAREVVVGETPERTDLECVECHQHTELCGASEETLEAMAAAEAREKYKSGVVQKVVEDAVLNRAHEWFTRSQIADDVKAAGIDTTRESIDQTLYLLGKKIEIEKRKKQGLGYEFRFGGPRPDENPVPPPLDHPEPKVERPQPIRHSNRPGPWEREARELAHQMRMQTGADVGSVVVVAEATVEQPSWAKQELEHVVNAAVIPQQHAPRAQAMAEKKEETVMASNDAPRVSTAPMSNGVARQLFILKSERMLDALERDLQDLVRNAIRAAREQIAKMAEEELR